MGSPTIRPSSYLRYGGGELGRGVDAGWCGNPGTILADGAGTWCFNYTGTVLPEGNHSFTAKATDKAGNVGPASAAGLSMSSLI